MAQVTETTFNDLSAIIVNGEIYFSGRGYAEKYMIPGAPYSPTYGYDGTREMLIYSTDKGITVDVSNNTDAIYVCGSRSYINSKYYREP